jgi:hypothetical protein
LLVHRYRIDALRWSASHHIAVQEPVSAMRNESSGKYTPGPPHCQAALNLCRSLEQRRDLGTCLTFISLSSELVGCRTSTANIAKLR